MATPFPYFLLQACTIFPGISNKILLSPSLRDQKVVGSNPVTPTTKMLSDLGKKSLSLFFYQLLIQDFCQTFGNFC